MTSLKIYWKFLSAIPFEACTEPCRSEIKVKNRAFYRYRWYKLLWRRFGGRWGLSVLPNFTVMSPVGDSETYQWTTEWPVSRSHTFSRISQDIFSQNHRNVPERYEKMARPPGFEAYRMVSAYGVIIFRAAAIIVIQNLLRMEIAYDVWIYNFTNW